MEFKSYWEKSIDMVREFEPMALQLDPRGYCVCSSFGKDSMALIEVFRMAEVKFFIQHNHTGIDPPELVRFGREQIKRYTEMGIDTVIIKPRKTMWELIPHKWLPPTRIVRYCCSELKERRVPETAGCMFSFGVRHAESNARKQRASLEVVTANIQNKQKYHVDISEEADMFLFNDNDEKRRQFENCTVKGVRAINPIIYWTDAQLWDFIRGNDISYCKLYDEGFTRLGCIGCPMAGNSRANSFARYPTYYRAYLRAFEKMLERREEAGKKTAWKTPQDVMDWWLSH